MKPNELMIGDWVYYKGKEQMPCRVISIGGNSIKFDNGTPQDWMSDAKNFTPIPLTEEILIKNGFGYIEKDYDADGNVRYTHAYLGVDCLCDNVDLHIGINNNGVFCVRWMHSVIYGLQFVHELQHAFRLMCIKREIEL